MSSFSVSSKNYLNTAPHKRSSGGAIKSDHKNLFDGYRLLHRISF